MQKITPFLWFDGNAEEAMRFYTSIFKRSRIREISRFDVDRPGSKGKVLTATFELEGQTFMALNGGPMFKFSPAVSFFVTCKTQQEVDYFWRRLSAGGKKQPCGWLRDKFGVSWQIVPTALGELLGDRDPAKADRVMQAMLKMGKIDIRKLQKAYAGH
jgi:predicted 3-demethylubiquinone-9 3-methyltransferase (glyoxalase superfamily)